MLEPFATAAQFVLAADRGCILALLWIAAGRPLGEAASRNRLPLFASAHTATPPRLCEATMTLFGRLVRAQDDPLFDATRTESPEQREDSVRNDLLTRLKKVCKDLPEADFQDLVAAMTREQLRSERLH